MARFDVYRMTRRGVPLAVNVQSEFLSSLDNRVLIPFGTVERFGPQAVERLNPVLTIGGGNYVLRTDEIAAVPTAAIGSFVENIEATHRDDITFALDFLFQGF